MNPVALRHKEGPEAKIQEKLIQFLRAREWFVKSTHGNMYQSGFPDLYCSHRRYGIRWIEVKYAESYSFTPAQLETFPLMSANGTGIWILVEACEEEYQKLWKPANWIMYLQLLSHKGCRQS